MPVVYLLLKTIQAVFTPVTSGAFTHFGTTEVLAEVLNRRISNFSFWFFLSTAIATFHFFAASAADHARQNGKGTRDQEPTCISMVQGMSFVGCAIWLLGFYLFEMWKTHGTFWSDDGIGNMPVDAVQVVEGSYNAFMLCSWAYAQAMSLRIVEHLHSKWISEESSDASTRRDRIAERVINGTLATCRLIALFVLLATVSLGFLTATNLLPRLQVYLSDNLRGVLG